MRKPQGADKHGVNLSPPAGEVPISKRSPKTISGIVDNDIKSTGYGVGFLKCHVNGRVGIEVERHRRQSFAHWQARGIARSAPDAHAFVQQHLRHRPPKAGACACDQGRPISIGKLAHAWRRTMQTLAPPNPLLLFSTTRGDWESVARMIFRPSHAGSSFVIWRNRA